jgi:hypothetical protein
MTYQKQFKGITGFWVPLHSPICSLSLLFSPTKFSANKIFLTSKKKSSSIKLDEGISN